MKKALGFAAKILFYAMIGVLLVLNASYTMTFVSSLFPDDFIKQWGSLILFDVGAIVWFLIFLTFAEGSGQRGVSLLGGIVDLVGSLIIAGAEVFGAAQVYLADPETSKWLANTATWVLFIWLGINIALTWMFHITAPKQQEEMRARNIKDETTAKALDMAEKKINQVAALLADEISDGIYTNILAELNVTNRSLLPQPRKVIDAQPVEEEEEEEQQPKYTERKRSPRKWSGHNAVRHAYAQETVTPAASKATGANGNARTDEPASIIGQDGAGGKPADPTKPR